MGNRIQGFLAGVVVTAGMALATSGRIKLAQMNASGLIRDTDYIINNRILTDRDAQLTPLPVNRRISTTYRPSVWETCKDIWNEEIICAANWVYSINWYQWGLEVDKRLNRMADKLVATVEKK